MILDYFNFIYDRHLIWHNRFVLKKDYPWSTDKVLNTYKFCNVYRELDRGTQYIINDVCNNDNLTEKEKVINIIAYRLFNVPGMYSDILKEPITLINYNFKDYEALLDEAKYKKGIKLMSEAYMFTGIHLNNYRVHDKHIQHLFAIDWIIKNIDDIFIHVKTMRLKNLHVSLLAVPAVGPFISYQIICDLSYVKGLLLESINNFVYVGPGAKPAIEYMYKSTDYANICTDIYNKQTKYFNALLTERSKDWKEIAIDSPYNQKPLLRLSDIQHNLCEYRKYVNYHNPNKKVRKRYYKQKGA